MMDEVRHSYTNSPPPSNESPPTLPCAYIPEQALPIERILSHLLARRKWARRTVAWITSNSRYDQT